MHNRKVSLTKIFTFDSAHHLNNYEGKCKNIHGHTYKLEVTVKGYAYSNGMVMDFHDLHDFVEKDILEQVDHKYLNDVFDFNPTCELMGLWFWDEIDKRITKKDCQLERIVLWETPTSYAAIDRDDILC